MNPFDDINDNNDNTKIHTIEIWVEANGRKKNTYISNWNLPQNELKEHLKFIKKKNGCNGTIKEISNESQTESIKVLQFQGDHIDFINQYLIQNNIDESQINIKGCN
jgi:translation initiation factor 1 (eIF-1/SUI1)